MLEKHVFTLAFGTSHNYAVNIFAVNADPCAAEIASPAKQQPPEPGESAAMRVDRLRNPIFFPFGRISRKGKCIQFTGQTLFAPLLKSLGSVYGPKPGESKEEAAT
ncbi:MAG: hypothetical protein ACLQVJ_00275 [Syntrophobacteraceae bacterium]